MHGFRQFRWGISPHVRRVPYPEGSWCVPCTRTALSKFLVPHPLCRSHEFPTTMFTGCRAGHHSRRRETSMSRLPLLVGSEDPISYWGRCFNPRPSDTSRSDTLCFWNLIHAASGRLMHFVPEGFNSNFQPSSVTANSLSYPNLCPLRAISRLLACGFFPGRDEPSTTFTDLRESGAG